LHQGVSGHVEISQHVVQIKWHWESLRTTWIKNVKFKIIKITTGCQYVGYLFYSENLNWATCGPRAAGWT